MMISITQLAFTYPKVYLSIIVVVSLAVLIKSSDFLLFGITRYSKKLGLSDYIIGLVVVALAASMPELVSALTGLAIGDSGIVIGTILGSNIGGLTLLLGIMAIIGKKLDIKSKLFNKVKLLVFIITTLPILLLIDGTLGRIDGGILVSLYLIYVAFLWKKEKSRGKLKKNVKIQHLWKNGLIFILALAGLLLSARWLIFGSTELAKRLNISSFVIATIIIGIGAQLPDLIVMIRAELAGHQDVGVGDLLGSTITKSLLFFGVLALIQPITLPFFTIAFSGIFFIGSMGALLLLMKKGYVNWKVGIWLIISYTIFLSGQLLI